jgi:DNA-binding response OmpR family regulator
MTSISTQTPRHAGARPIVKKKLRIVVAEDEALIGELLAEMLADLGHDVCAIEATELGLVMAAARCRPDLLLVDVHLGDSSGVSGIAHVLSIGFVPHVFMTGEPIRLRNSGAVVLQKPFWECDLVRAMERARMMPPPPLAALLR